MELMEQCQIWNENSEYQKIIDALEAIPAERRTPEMDSELARAYNNKAGPEDKELFRKAIALLEPHADYFKGDHCWNFRMAYAYYYLDQEGPALHYFEQALEARPGDEDTQELIDDCRRRLTLPQFGRPFRARVREAWAAFEQIEGELRAIMDADQTRERGEELVAKCEGELNLALLRQFAIRTLVTKESGDFGGFREKAEAAEAAGCALLMVARPRQEKGVDCDTFLEDRRKELAHGR